MRRSARAARAEFAGLRYCWPLNGLTDYAARSPFVRKSAGGRALTDHLRARAPEYNERFWLCPDEEGENDEADEVVDARAVRRSRALSLPKPPALLDLLSCKRRPTIGLQSGCQDCRIDGKSRGMVLTAHRTAPKDREILVHAFPLDVGICNGARPLSAFDGTCVSSDNLILVTAAERAMTLAFAP